MLSLISSCICNPISTHPSPHLNVQFIPPLVVLRCSKKRFRVCRRDVVSGQFVEVRRGRRGGDSSWCCLCNLSEGNLDLEEEILEFMNESEKPDMFPTRDELIRGGRMDLVEMIQKIGGWYSYGWNEENDGDKVEENLDFDIKEFQRRAEDFEATASVEENGVDSSSWGEEDGSSDAQLDSSSSSSGRLLETSASEDTGINGILDGLQKQRNIDFGIDIRSNGDDKRSTAEAEEDENDFRTEVARVVHGENGRFAASYHSGILNKAGEKISSDLKPENWRTWSSNRAGSQYSDFEAAEISSGKFFMEHVEDGNLDELNTVAREYVDAQGKPEKAGHFQIRTRLQQLESELSVTLRSLRSKKEENVQEKVVGRSVNDLQILSDEQEFQENEIMSAQERLRLIRAKLAVLEGKMAMAISDAQTMVEQRQQQIEGAHRALTLLRPTHIVWHNSASEVLLAGSFDGWTNQRKMEKSEKGIFSVSLMLYPGRYEIKFVVDGKWKVDPLRPIVHGSGYENNLLIVS